MIIQIIQILSKRTFKFFQLDESWHMFKDVLSNNWKFTFIVIVKSSFKNENL